VKRRTRVPLPRLDARGRTRLASSNGEFLQAQRMVELSRLLALVSFREMTDDEWLEHLRHLAYCTLQAPGSNLPGKR